MSDHREIEAKFEADESTLDTLLTLERFGEFNVARDAEKLQDDVYYDSAAGHLKDAGASLRIRRKGPDVQMTFKGERAQIANTVSRLEDEVVLPGEAVSHLGHGDPLTLDFECSPYQRARSLTGVHDLIPIARLRTSRTILLASNLSGVAIELAVDRCSGTRVTDERTVQFAEVEAELKAGSSDELERALVHLLRAVPGLRPSEVTKLERALE